MSTNAIEHPGQHVGYSNDLAGLQRTAYRWGFVIPGQISTVLFDTLLLQEAGGCTTAENYIFRVM